MTDIPELTEEQLKRAIPARLRRRLMEGRFESGQDQFMHDVLASLLRDLRRYRFMGQYEDPRYTLGNRDIQRGH